MPSEFPPTAQALSEPNGLLAVGGDLSPSRLLDAYRRGIFPWYEAGQPVLWWTPNPRTILIPETFQPSRSLRRSLRRRGYTLTLNRDFSRVMRACAAPRDAGVGTWISDDMVAAYSELHRLGYAHAIEVYQEDELIGGLYGVRLGGAFFGESMFASRTDASKVALVALVWLCLGNHISLIDCQVASDHLFSLGAIEIPRERFENLLTNAINGIESTGGDEMAGKGFEGSTLAVPPPASWTTALPVKASDLLLELSF